MKTIVLSIAIVITTLSLSAQNTELKFRSETLANTSLNIVKETNDAVFTLKGKSSLCKYSLDNGSGHWIMQVVDLLSGASFYFLKIDANTLDTKDPALGGKYVLDKAWKPE